jgi:DNA-binding GntR family transcriptional regulator
LKPKKLVDHAVDAIVAAAARGEIQAGERLSEPKLEALLGISRVPIREALRILESQGVTSSEPYKGVRFMPVTPERLKHLVDVRLTLEGLACKRAIEAGRNGPAQIEALHRCVAKLKSSFAVSDVYGFAAADTDFHRVLCSFADNPVIDMVWASLARQITVVLGLTIVVKPMGTSIQDHLDLVALFADGDREAMDVALHEHILDQMASADFHRLLARR